MGSNSSIHIDWLYALDGVAPIKGAARSIKASRRRIGQFNLVRKFIDIKNTNRIRELIRTIINH